MKSGEIIAAGGVRMKYVYSKASMFMVAVMLLLGCSQDSMTDKEYLDKANQYYSNGEVSASVIELKNALKKNPRNADARLLLGRIYVQLADGASGEKELRRAREYGNQSSDAVIYLVKALVLQRKLNDALQELETIAADDKVETEKLALQVEIYLAKGNIKEAKRMVEKLIASHVATVSAYLAIAKYEITDKQFDSAKLSIEKALNVNDKSSEAWLLQGAVAELQGNNLKAQEAYLQVISIEPKRNLTPRSLTARTALAFSFLRENNTDATKEHTDVLYKANKKHVLPNYLYGVLAYREKNYETALEYLQVAHTNNENHSPTRLLLGSVSYALGNYNQAESFLTSYIARVPQNIAAIRLLGATYLKLGKTSKAMNVLKSSLEDNPNDSQLLAMIGEVATRAGKIKDAELYIRKSMKAGGDASRGHMQLATAYLASGEFDAAIKELEGLAKLSGVDEFARVRTLMLAYLRNNQTEKALNEAKQYANSFPGETRAFNMLGAVYMSMRDVESAKRHFNNALKINSNDKTALLNRARLAVVANNLSEGRTWLQKVLGVDKKNILAMMLMARIEELDGEKVKAIDWLEKARNINAKVIPPRLLLSSYYFKIKDYKKVHIYIDEILDIQSNNRLALGLRVDTYLRQGEKAKALESAHILVKKAPKQAEAHTKLGQIYAGQNKFAKARKSLRTALELKSGFYPATVALAQLELKDGKPQRALEIANDLQNRQPKSPAGFTLHGDINMVTKDFGQAVKSYKKAMQLGKNPTLISKVTNALYKSGESWPVIQAPLQAWLKTHPKDDFVRLRLGLLARAKGKIDTSIAAYRKIVEHQPTNVVILNDFAWILYEHKKSKEAISLAKKAHDLKPDLAASQDTYGWILVQEGKMVQGLELIKKAHVAIPKHPDITYHYAYALHQVGEKTESKAVVEKLLKENKVFDSRKEAEELRAKL